jgi:hypothetical protein
VFQTFRKSDWMRVFPLNIPDFARTRGAHGFHNICPKPTPENEIVAEPSLQFDQTYTESPTGGAFATDARGASRINWSRHMAEFRRGGGTICGMPLGSSAGTRPSSL